MNTRAFAAGLAALLICTVSGANPVTSGVGTRPAEISRLVANGAYFIRFRSDDHGAQRVLRVLYEQSEGAPLWVLDSHPTPQALALLRTLAAADEFGLEPRDYEAGRIAAIATLTLPAFVARPAERMSRTVAEPYQPVRWDLFDVNLTAAALKLISDLHYGRIDPPSAGFDLGIPRPDDLDLATVVRALASARDIEHELGTIEPQFLHYRLLERALARYRALAEAQPTEAMRSRVREIDLTLERWRWLPVFQTPPLIVNIPQFRLFAFRTTVDQAADILQMDVIVGRTFPRTRTPVFVADLKSVLFRPYWDVPRSITLREMLPKIRAKPSILAEQHLEIVRGAKDDSAVVLPASPESITALASGAARLRQRPGPDNALGLIKFDLPNRYDVYLHSTPARQLFLKSHRAFSHGCIRVSDPVALAAYVLRDTPGDWSPEKIERAMNGKETRRVRLARPIRVMVLYGTVLAKENGEVLFFNDLYGQDRRLEALLGLPPVEAPHQPT